MCRAQLLICILGLLHATLQRYISVDTNQSILDLDHIINDTKVYLVTAKTWHRFINTLSLMQLKKWLWRRTLSAVIYGL